MFLARPVKSFWRMYSEILSSAKPTKTVLLLFSGLIIGWLIYVPIHELLHAAGCVLGGGDVSRLEIQPVYGGAFLSRIFSFVVAESDYAGRLSGFDTHGSDLTYGLTVYFPFLLSLFAFFCLELAVRKKSAFAFGFFLPCAFAPLISLTGDFLELGSILAFQLWPGPSDIHRLLISDDLFRLIKEMCSGEPGMPFTPDNIIFIILSFLIGTALAWGTILLSDGIRELGFRQVTKPFLK